MRPKAVIYCRVSTEDQEEGTSLETQRVEGLKLATRLGLDVPEDHVIVEVESGRKFDQRPGIIRVKRMLHQRMVQVVIAQKIDRISRHPAHFYHLWQAMQETGARFEWTDQTYADSPDGRMTMGMMVLFAERELEMITERTRSGLKARVEREGCPLPGWKEPFGYMWADEKKSRLVVHPENGPFWRGILRELASGTPANRVATRLNKAGIPTPSGKAGARWTASNIAKMATNPIYHGVWEVWRNNKRDARLPDNLSAEDKARIRAEQEKHRRENVVRLEGIVDEPLIELAEWNAIQQRLANNKRESARNNPNPERSLLRAGFARCGKCGNTATVHRQKTHGVHHLVYHCNPQNRIRHGCPSFYVRVKELDDIVWAYMRHLLNDPEIFIQQVEAHRAQNTVRVDVGFYEKQLADLSQRAVNLTDRAADEDDDELRASFKQRLKEVLAQKRATEAEIERLREQNRSWDARQKSLDDLVTLMRQFNRRLERDASYQIKRAALHMLGVELRLYNSKDPDHDRWELSYGFIGQERQAVAAHEIASALGIDCQDSGYHLHR